MSSMSRGWKRAKTSNVTFRLTLDEKALLEDGTVLAGAPDLTTFVIVPALDLARALSERELVTTLTAESRRLFIELMKRPPTPSARLLHNLRDERHEIID